MFQAKYKNFEIPRKYNGFKIYESYSIPTFRVFLNEKIIEFNPVFIKSLNGFQKFFIITWCIKFHKKQNYEAATLSAMNIYKFCGLPEADIISLLDRINQNKKISKFIQYNVLIYISKNKIRNFFYKLINIIKNGKH